MSTEESTISQETADRLNAEFHLRFSNLEAPPDLFASDTFLDFLPPLWRYQFEGPSEAFAEQLRSIAEGPVEIVVRTVPSSTGFVTEHIETQHTPTSDVVARRIHLSEVDDGRISAVTTYCNGGWDADPRARHAAEAPMAEGRS